MRSFKIRILNFFRNIFKLPFLESWLAAHTLHRSTRHFFSRLVPNPYQYTSPETRNFIRDGIRLTTDISDYLGHYYYFGFRDLSHEKLFALCKPGFNIFDIGANIGFTTLKLAQLSNSGMVISFEPDPINYSQCIRNLTQNNLLNIHVLNIALGNDEAILPMEVRTSSNRGGNRISIQHTNGNEVQIKKLDNLWPQFNITKVHLIKMDVEGYELKVLKGAEQTLKSFKPILFVELDEHNLRDQGDSAKALINFLIQTGYTDIVNAETNRPIDPYTDFSDCHYDIIARP